MSLEERIVEKLEKRGLYLTTAESCTCLLYTSMYWEKCVSGSALNSFGSAP